MTVIAEVDGIRFTFPAGWQALKYDDSSFHRNQFQRLPGGSKALDIVAMSPDKTLWLIEAKDYGRHRREMASSVFAEVAAKVRATLAGLATARVRANDPAERAFASLAMTCLNLQVALHLDQAVKPSKLFPHAIDPKTAVQQLRRELGVIDRRAVCYGKGVAPNHTAWVTQSM